MTPAFVSKTASSPDLIPIDNGYYDLQNRQCVIQTEAQEPKEAPHVAPIAYSSVQAPPLWQKIALGILQHSPLGLFTAGGCDTKREVKKREEKKEISNEHKLWCSKVSPRMPAGVDFKVNGDEIDEFCGVFPLSYLYELRTDIAYLRSLENKREIDYHYAFMKSKYLGEELKESYDDLVLQYLDCTTKLFKDGQYWAAQSLRSSLFQYANANHLPELKDETSNLGMSMFTTIIACPEAEDDNFSTNILNVDHDFDFLQPYVLNSDEARRLENKP